MCTYVARIFIWLWNCLSMSYSMIEEKVLVEPFLHISMTRCEWDCCWCCFSLRFSKNYARNASISMWSECAKFQSVSILFKRFTFFSHCFFFAALSFLRSISIQSQSICDQLLTIDVRVNIYCSENLSDACEFEHEFCCIEIRIFLRSHTNTHTPKYRHFQSISRIKVGISTRNFSNKINLYQFIN